MTKRILAWSFLVFAGIFWMAGCAQKDDSGEQDTQRVRTIAVATLMTHPALDSVAENMQAELSALGFTEGENVRYIVRNASGQVPQTATIANDLSARQIDVIVAITTPMAQAVARNAKVPVVFAAVTDPVGAGLVSSLETGDPVITGTSDAWPYEGQLSLIREISPSARTLGVLFNPGEAASQYGIRQIREHAQEYGFVLIEGPVSSTNEVYAVAQNLAGRVDALFLSSDNTVIAGVAAAVKVATEHKIALYVGDSGTVAKGGLAAVSVGYAELGRETGRLVARVLAGERGIPVHVGRGADVHVNTKAAELMGVVIPDSVLQRAVAVYDKIEQ